MRRQLGIDALEHVARRRLAAGMQRAEALGLLLRRDHRLQDLGLGLLVALLAPGADRDQMLLQPQQRVAERPAVRLLLGAIGGGVVRGRMRAGAVGDVFDQRRAEIAAGPLDRPLRHGIGGEVVVAVDAQGRNAETEAPRREGAGAAARDALEGRDRPLVVDDVEDDGGLVGRGEDERGVEIRFRRRAIADPGGGDLRVALDRRGHRPADGLDELRGEIAGDREEAVLLRGIHDRELPPLQRVALVGVDLAHHVDERVLVGDEKPRLAVGREVHVAGPKCDPEGAAHRLFAGVLHVERGLALALGHLHAGVEAAQRHHVTQAPDQILLAEVRHPGADRLPLAVQHADDRIGEIADVLRLDIDRRALDRAGLGDHHMGEIRLLARAGRRLRHVKAKGCVGHALRP